MEVRLVLKSGKSAGKEIPVSGPKFVIGRAEDCQLRPHSDQVSRHHCEITVEEGGVHVRDCGSRNGTRVNGREISGSRELKTGDRISVGPLEFDVRVRVDVGGKKKPKVKSIEEAAARTVQAAAAAPDDDDRLADWLLNAGPVEEPDTDPFGLVATQKSDADLLAGPAPAPDEKKGGVKVPGRFTAVKAAAESSRAAAAETLRQLFNKK